MRCPGWHATLPGANGEEGEHLLVRTTADTGRSGLRAQSCSSARALPGSRSKSLLLLTALAYLYVRRLLRPLDDIRAGAQRLVRAHLTSPSRCAAPTNPTSWASWPPPSTPWAATSTRCLTPSARLLLAMSHELRSPLTRARLNAELLPETPVVDPQRQALLRDLGEMARLITDLLESERLAGSHAALHREPVDLAALAREVVAELGDRHASAAAIALHAPPGLPALALDRTHVLA